jgi:hypothetical protein
LRLRLCLRLSLRLSLRLALSQLSKLLCSRWPAKSTACLREDGRRCTWKVLLDLVDQPLWLWQVRVELRFDIGAPLLRAREGAGHWCRAILLHESNVPTLLDCAIVILAIQLGNHAVMSLRLCFGIFVATIGELLFTYTRCISYQTTIKVQRKRRMSRERERARERDRERERERERESRYRYRYKHRHRSWISDRSHHLRWYSEPFRHTSRIAILLHVRIMRPLVPRQQWRRQTRIQRSLRIVIRIVGRIESRVTGTNLPFRQGGRWNWLLHRTKMHTRCKYFKKVHIQREREREMIEANSWMASWIVMRNEIMHV